MNRILVIRGGAIGDFILTLPALRALREAYPKAHVEILGYKHIVALAENRFYTQATRSIEYGLLSSFFGKSSELPDELINYFGGFDFARPLEQLGIFITDFAAQIFPSAQDRQFAREFLRQVSRPIVAIHPGSGSERKNWPLKNWVEFGEHLLASDNCSLLIVSGEADEAQVAQLQSLWKNERVVFAKDLPLPHLAGVLEQTVFVGHDSGISHLAAAAGANCILLFGPTDPKIWAPQNENVCVIQGANNNVENVATRDVQEAVAAALRAARRAIG